jgi:GDP-L-fucose synthase
MDDPVPINLGASSEILIRDLVGLVADACGFTGRIEWDPGKPDGQPRRAVDAARARELLGWQANTTLADGLRATVEWYRRNRGHRSGYDPSRSAQGSG